MIINHVFDSLATQIIDKDPFKFYNSTHFMYDGLKNKLAGKHLMIGDTIHVTLETKSTSMVDVLGQVVKGGDPTGPIPLVISWALVADTIAAGKGKVAFKGIKPFEPPIDWGLGKDGPLPGVTISYDKSVMEFAQHLEKKLEDQGQIVKQLGDMVVQLSTEKANLEEVLSSMEERIIKLEKKEFQDGEFIKAIGSLGKAKNYLYGQLKQTNESVIQLVTWHNMLASKDKSKVMPPLLNPPHMPDTWQG